MIPEPEADRIPDPTVDDMRLDLSRIWSAVKWYDSAEARGDDGRWADSFVETLFRRCHAAESQFAALRAEVERLRQERDEARAEERERCARIAEDEICRQLATVCETAASPRRVLAAIRKGA